jgi:hypothetical protein
VRKCQLTVKVETSHVVIKEAIDLLDYLGGEPLELEGVEEVGVVYYIKGSLNI